MRVYDSSVSSGKGFCLMPSVLSMNNEAKETNITTFSWNLLFLEVKLQ